RAVPCAVPGTTTSRLALAGVAFSKPGVAVAAPYSSPVAVTNSAGAVSLAAYGAIGVPCRAASADRLTTACGWLAAAAMIAALAPGEAPRKPRAVTPCARR